MRETVGSLAIGNRKLQIECLSDPALILPFHIRLATSADIPALMRVEREADTASHWSMEQYQAAFAQNTSRSVLLVENASTIYGFVVVHAIAQQWEIENLAVASTTRRKGLGMQLVREALAIARHQGAQEIFLEVRESNLAARALYEKSGFTQSARRKRYYRTPDEDAIIYRLRCS
jgi:[ribosomal protein S18]-alanine N-acetyltransferase